MDLPTYTNIWRIEKRLYKLYDLRLPMPLPLGQIAAFVGITVPYVLLLTLIGVPFTHTLFWLYVLPPGVLTWLVTRPVIENKKLPELLVSQVRYLGEPNVWCRMAPSTEKDEIIVVGRVWHACQQAAPRVSTVEHRQPVPVRVHAAGQPTWAAPAPVGQGRPAEPRHRKPAAGRPQPAVTAVGQAAAVGQATAVGQAAVRSERAAAGSAQQRARSGPGPVPGPRAMPPGPEAPERTAATWPQRRGPRPRPAPPAPGHVQQPEWALRARPSGPLGKPANTPRPRVIEVAHTEDNQPARWPAAGGLRPVRGIADAQPGRLPLGAPQLAREPKPPAAGVARAHPVGPVPAVPPPVRAVQPLAVASDDDQRAAQGARYQVGQPGPSAAGVAHAGPAGPGPVVPRPARAAVPGGQPSDVASDTRPPGDPSGARGAGQPASRPAPLVIETRGPGQERPAPPIERVLSGSPGPGGRGWHDPVGLDHAGQGPGKSRETEQEERDQARACLPLPGPCRIVVLGCTSGAGQTVTALMTARLLASLRAEPVAALDLNPGRGSLARQSRSAPAGTVRDLLGWMSRGVAGGGRAPAGLQVIGADEAPESVKGLSDGDFGTIGESLSARYRISLIDPGASAVGRVLAIADQLVLVAPASGDAPRAVSMTQEWLAAHDHHRLAANAVLVVNGVSGRSMPYVEQAEAIAAGRCRAIVRVPWEDQLGAGGGPYADAVPPRAPARRALTRLAALIVSGLAGARGTSAPGEPR